MHRMNRILSKVRHSMGPSNSSTPNATLNSDSSATADETDIAQTTATTSSSVPIVEHAQTERVRKNAPGNCLLEKLPPEVRRHILYVSGFEELRASIHASPVFHQQYLLDRRPLLLKSLETMLGNVAVDACAVYQSSWADYEDLCTEDEVAHFLESYQNRRCSTQRPNVSATLTEDQTVNILAFHLSVVKPLVWRYTGWTLANLTEKTEDPQGHKPLSKMEETRLLRAIYRFQLCCNLFGKGRHRTLQGHRLDFDSLDILKIFFCLFEPWEVEEIACIYTFAKERYTRILREIRWDVHKENPKFESQRPPTPEGAFDLDNDFTRGNLLTGTISRGLDLLHTVCCTIKDHEHLVSTMQANICHQAGFFLEDEALGETTQYRRRQERRCDRDEKQLRRDPMPFRGDGEPDEHGPRPPLAWTLMWGEKYSNLYGYYVPDNIRRWGYVMWDAVRLEQTGAKDDLLQQWDETWGIVDPNHLLQ